MKQFFFLLLALACAPFANAQTDYSLVYYTKYKYTANSELLGTTQNFSGNFFGVRGNTYVFGINESDGSKTIRTVGADGDLVDNSLSKVTSIADYTISAEKLAEIEANLNYDSSGKKTFYYASVMGKLNCHSVSLLLSETNSEKGNMAWYFNTEAEAQTLIDFLKK